MPARLNGSTSGYTELSAPAVAGNNTIVLPANNGSAGQSMTTDGSGNLSFGSSIVSGTSQASTSGTSIDFTGIPSWAKRVTVMFRGVSTNGSSPPQVQIGSGSVTTSGYLGSNSLVVGGAITVNFTTGFGIGVNTTNWNSTSVTNGLLVMSSIGSNAWVAAGTFGDSNTTATRSTAGSVTLSGTLDRVRITTVNGTDTFDAGTINILYE